MSRVGGWLLQFGCGAAGLITGHCLGRAALVLGHPQGWPDTAVFLSLAAVAFVAIVCGFTGLWIGRRLTPLAHRATPLLAFVLFLSYFVWQDPDLFRDVRFGLALFHPISLAALVLAVIALTQRWPWPPLPVMAAWVALPMVLNSLLWYFGLPLFGWIFEDLGIFILFGLILPLNGALLGWGVAPALWRWLTSRSLRSPGYIGFGVLLAILVVNLFVLGQFDLYVGIAGYRR